jgi:hypothetical protein
LPSPGLRASTEPSAVTTIAFGRTVAVSGWSPDRTIHKGAGFDSVVAVTPASQDWTFGNGFQPVTMLYVTTSAMMPISPRNASMRPTSRPCAMRRP